MILALSGWRCVPAGLFRSNVLKETCEPDNLRENRHWNWIKRSDHSFRRGTDTGGGERVVPQGPFSVVKDGI